MGDHVKRKTWCMFVCVETGICVFALAERLASLCGEIGVCSEGEAI